MRGGSSRGIQPELWAEAGAEGWPSYREMSRYDQTQGNVDARCGRQVGVIPLGKILGLEPGRIA